MFALLKTGIQKMKNISVNSPKRCAKLEKFWSQQILPFMMNNLFSTATFPDM